MASARRQCPKARGLNASSDDEIRIYYDNVKAKQDADLRPGVTVLCDVICRSELGKELPKGFAFDFVPLWQLSDTEKADIGAKDTNSVVQAFDSGIVDRGTALKELRQSSNTTGLWSNITDEDIAAAEAEPPPTSGEGDLTDGLDHPGQKAKPEPGKDE